MRNGRDFRRERNAEAFEVSENVTAGRNSVRELLASGRDIDKIFVQKGERTGSITSLIAEARSRSIPVVECEKAKLDHISGGINHQGIAAFAAEKEYCEIDDIISYAEELGQKPLIVIADRIEDPHNLGALIRAAEVAGAHGLIIPKRKGAMLTQVVSKASAGALEHLRIAKVTNLAMTVEDLKKRGLWIFAAEAGGAKYYEQDMTCPAAIILGSEGHGVAKLLLDKCDFILSIPMYGKVNSFNVAAAAAVVLCEAARQRNS
ncbi:MAG: 23S rRNA (guanosine(2251)-2'-O)-methyltransferase RlmB [Clostridia bacterium]|nr:23S rRNA (guanosine(2251)-2'-O)-methyltransferase RlmB [Clostridia bacterium]